MKPLEIYRATKEYKRLKLLYGLGLTLLFTALYAVMVGLSSLATPVLSYIMIPVWIALSLFLLLKIYGSAGWRIDAGHLYLMTAAYSEGRIPPNPVSVVNELINLRFTKKRYQALRKRVTSAVMQINDSLLSATSLVGDIAGMKLMNQIGRFFLGLHTVYMRDCVLSYTFLQTDKSEDESSVNGCAFYSINWRPLSERASDIAILSVCVVLIPTAALGIGLGYLIKLIGLGSFAYFGGFLAFMLVLTIKYATLDCWFEVHYIDRFLHLAAYSVPSDRCYTQLSRVSPMFAKMLRRLGGHVSVEPQTLPARRRKKAPKPQAIRRPDSAHPVVCPRCRTANKQDARFCAGCGLKLQ